ncbi:MAG: Nramp family divalent metal transporter [Rhizomicrobium sp.]
MRLSSTGEAALSTDISARTVAAMNETLNGSRHGLKAMLPFVGPAVVASVAYLDPGNFAANIQAGAGYGYQLLWVVVAANLIAMLFQSMAAKIGIVTGRNLAELSRDHFSRPVRLMMWGAAEVAAMATDLAEFLGGAVGFMLLLHIPLIPAMAAMAVLTYAILSVDRAGFRPMELVIGGFVALIAIAYVLELVIAPPDWAAAGRGIVLPHIADSGALLLAVGVVGSTVMPHAIYLHSGLTQARAPAAFDGEKARLIRYSNREVLVALGLAGFVNLAMVIMAAHAFHGMGEVATLETAYRTLIPALGGAAAGLFLIALTAAGVSSSVVVTMAGQMIMQGFVGFRIPIWVRRLVTMLPAFVVAIVGWDITHALVISQVILSVVLPVPMFALIRLSRRADLMGRFAASTKVTVAATAAALLVIGLNLFLIGQTVLG